ncbi:hypothetical protein [Sphingobacterium sp. MYb388]|uniref:hypothetical protein n=1 Tax=Sphingobacterium sp. MYb388 TaxID=2745437 RepID=UPI00309EDF5B
MENEKVFAVVEFDDGLCFKVDFRNMKLIEVDNPENTMRLNDMRDNGEGYEFYYDPRTKNIAEVPEGFVEGRTGPYAVQLSYLTTFHPYAMSLAHNVPIGSVKGKTDQEFLKDKLRTQTKKETRARIWGKGLKR